jgi:hypothetical protein
VVLERGAQHQREGHGRHRHRVLRDQLGLAGGGQLVEQLVDKGPETGNDPFDHPGREGDAHEAAQPGVLVAVGEDEDLHRLLDERPVLEAGAGQAEAGGEVVRTHQFRAPGVAAHEPDAEHARMVRRHLPQRVVERIGILRLRLAEQLDENVVGVHRV